MLDSFLNTLVIQNPSHTENLNMWRPAEHQAHAQLKYCSN